MQGHGKRREGRLHLRDSLAWSSEETWHRLAFPVSSTARRPCEASWPVPTPSLGRTCLCATGALRLFQRMMNLGLQPGLSRGVSLAMVGPQSSLLGAESLLDQCCYCRDAMAPASLPNGVWSAPGAKCPQRRAKMPSPAPPQEVEERLLVLGQSSWDDSVVRSQR